MCPFIVRCFFTFQLTHTGLDFVQLGKLRKKNLLHEKLPKEITLQIFQIFYFFFFYTYIYIFTK